MRLTYNERDALRSIKGRGYTDGAVHGRTLRALLAKGLITHAAAPRTFGVTTEGARHALAEETSHTLTTDTTPAPITTQRQVNRLLDEIKDEIDRLHAIVSLTKRREAAQDLIEYIQLHHEGTP